MTIPAEIEKQIDETSTRMARAAGEHARKVLARVILEHVEVSRTRPEKRLRPRVWDLSWARTPGEVYARILRARTWFEARVLFASELLLAAQVDVSPYDRRMLCTKGKGR